MLDPTYTVQMGNYLMFYRRKSSFQTNILGYIPLSPVIFVFVINQNAHHFPQCLASHFLVVVHRTKLLFVVQLKVRNSFERQLLAHFIRMTVSRNACLSACQFTAVKIACERRLSPCFGISCRLSYASKLTSARLVWRT